MMDKIKISIMQAECSKCKQRDLVLLIDIHGKSKTLCSKCLTEYVNQFLKVPIFNKFFSFIEKRGLNEDKK